MCLRKLIETRQGIHFYILFKKENIVYKWHTETEIYFTFYYYVHHMEWHIEIFKSSDVTRKQVGNLVKPLLSLITPQYIQRGA